MTYEVPLLSGILIEIERRVVTMFVTIAVYVMALGNKSIPTSHTKDDLLVHYQKK